MLFHNVLLLFLWFKSLIGVIFAMLSEHSLLPLNSVCVCVSMSVCVCVFVYVPSIIVLVVAIVVAIVIVSARMTLEKSFSTCIENLLRL